MQWGKQTEVKERERKGGGGGEGGGEGEIHNRFRGSAT